ncbi:hypothetical protein RRG08_010072 [Elysia crispata]|uniref:Uncharacterized protein n=1 Tax=Elysia crispata TaxID=231223 RepID=A0AAE1BA81_9GAST|nr:hypothetical protein RRG08_010072 [Elysia crispata]
MSQWPGTWGSSLSHDVLGLPRRTQVSGEGTEDGTQEAGHEDTSLVVTTVHVSFSGTREEKQKGVVTGEVRDLR